jgi:hypothetical protein
LAGDGQLDEESQQGNPTPIRNTAKGAALRAAVPTR